MVSSLQSPIITVSDNVDDVFDQLYDLGATDGLPVIPPTDERVERFVAASGRPAGELIAEMSPRSGCATVEKIAINAVMAGCRPEYMPVLIAVVRAVCDPAFNFHGIQATTNAASPLIVINGPIRKQLDVNCGRGALGPGRRANATIGRALRLMQVNIGGAIPGEVDKATLGMPGKYTLCLGELEEESPWAPLHVERGLRPEQSAVTVIGVQGTDNLLVWWRQASSILSLVAQSISSPAFNSCQLGEGNPVIILNPGHAALLAQQGYTKLKVKESLYELSKLPLSAWPKEVSEGQVPERRRHVVDGFAMVARKADDIVIVVAGGPEAYHITSCISFGDTWAVTKAIDQ